MKGRSLMLNGAVLSFEDSGSRFSKNVTIEARCAARAATCTRRTWRSTWTSTRLSTTTAIAPPPSAIPACASTLSPRRWRIWMPVAPSPSRACVRRPHVYGTARTVKAAHTPRAHRICGQPHFSLPGTRPHEPEPCGGAFRSFGRAHGRARGYASQVRRHH